jgi:hypothetical protein
MKNTNTILNTEHFAIEVKEVEEGVIIDVFHRHGDLINSYTYWNDDCIDHQKERSTKMDLTCPYCHCDNQDFLVGIGENKLLCEACDKEFHETEVVMKEPKKEEQKNADL